LQAEQGALAQRGIAVKFVESWPDGAIVQRSAAQIGWGHNFKDVRVSTVMVSDCEEFWV
jgi:hypothetical protein